MAIAYFSSEHGSEIQRRAYEEIMKVYPDEKRVAYITALTKEILRFWSSIPMVFLVPTSLLSTGRTLKFLLIPCSC